MFRQMKIVGIFAPFVFGRMTRSLLLITNQATQNLVLVKKKCYVMSDHQEMMKKKFHSDNFQLVELKN